MPKIVKVPRAPAAAGGPAAEVGSKPARSWRPVDAFECDVGRCPVCRHVLKHVYRRNGPGFTCPCRGMK